jgi:hypothetical protein
MRLFQRVRRQYSAEFAMRSWKPAIFGLFAVLGIGCLIYAADPNEKQGKQAPAKISAEDLCVGKCIIIGRLGKPYGEISRIRAVWKANDQFKGESFFLRVVEIDGKTVAEEHPIEISEFDVKWLKKDHGNPPKQRGAYEGRVYESGGYDRQPEKVDAILGIQPYQYRGFGFCSFLHFID